MTTAQKFFIKAVDAGRWTFDAGRRIKCSESSVERQTSSVIHFQIFLYNFALRCYLLSIHLAAFFLPKAKKWVTGRQQIFQKLAKDFSKKEKVVWMHCASLGEFEQGRPIIEGIKKQYPNWKILLTFYSPSGYEIRKNYDLADWVYYLPEDSNKNAIQFLEIVQPEMAIFVKYEFWFHYLNQLHKRQIPTFLISAIFRESQPFFKWYGNLHRKMLTFFEHIFLQNEVSGKLLEEVTVTFGGNCYLEFSVVGDTRIDRVLAIQKQEKDLEIIEKFCATEKDIFITGSTWEEDEVILIPFINNSKSNNYKFIIAPHSISKSHISKIEKQLKVPFMKYSEAELSDTLKVSDNLPKVLIIDNIGLLAFLYKFGKTAYIGGAFGSGLHNILEPAAAGIPIIFGKKYQKFQEAIDLIKLGGAFSIQSEKEFMGILEKLSENDFYQKSAESSQKYLMENKGASEKILESLSAFFTQRHDDITN